KQKYIGQYKIVEKIGSGGMGTVYYAHNIRDKTQIAAVKVLKEELTEDEMNRRRFKYEGTIIDKLAHPNIVKIYERGEYKEKLYIAMEYLRGKTLARKIREDGIIDINEALHIMTGIADALVFIHDQGVVHRDLKPANIMLIEKEGEPLSVKLLDFGLALMNSQTRLTQSGFLVGTVNYISPEQIIENRYSSAGDVYALGIIFYEMVVGEQVFPGNSITVVMEKILDTEPPEPSRIRPDIPVALERLIMQMLSKDPDRRPSAGDVLAALKTM
ncbi:MAG: serine/threonine protein kinase, partial [bacterium]|nr:serine/threonine protein kinase [bacterium]